MFKKSIITILTASALIGGNAFAKQGQLVEFNVSALHQGIMQEYYHQGDTYIAGDPPGRYELQVKNKTGQRLLAVVSVDGLNVLSGKTADFEQTGYILEPYQTISIDGWRKSTNEVARFFFTDLANSYADRTHRPENVGVLGVAVFTEKVRVKPVPKYNRPYDYGGAPASSLEMAPAQSMAKGGANLAERSTADKVGTGHGERVYSEVEYSRFHRESKHPAEVVSLFYDSTRNLVKKGVIKTYNNPFHGKPNPFPRGDFVPDPPSRRY